MLRCLHIPNLAIVRDLTLGLGAGLNLLTGETGAGKSILVDALALVLGGRSGPEMIRAGAERASVEAEFDVSSNRAARVFLEERGFPIDAGSVGARPGIPAPGKGTGLPGRLARGAVGSQGAGSDPGRPARPAPATDPPAPSEPPGSPRPSRRTGRAARRHGGRVAETRGGHGPTAVAAGGRPAAPAAGRRAALPDRRNRCHGPETWRARNAARRAGAPAQRRDHPAPRARRLRGAVRGRRGGIASPRGVIARAARTAALRSLAARARAADRVGTGRPAGDRVRAAGLSVAPEFRASTAGGSRRPRPGPRGASAQIRPGWPRGGSPAPARRGGAGARAARGWRGDRRRARDACRGAAVRGAAPGHLARACPARRGAGARARG